MVTVRPPVLRQHTHSILHKSFVHRSRCELGGCRVGIEQKQDPALTDTCLSCWLHVPWLLLNIQAGVQLSLASVFITGYYWGWQWRKRMVKKNLTFFNLKVLKWCLRAPSELYSNLQNGYCHVYSGLSFWNAKVGYTNYYFTVQSGEGYFCRALEVCRLVQGRGHWVHLALVKLPVTLQLTWS